MSFVTSMIEYLPKCLTGIWISFFVNCLLWNAMLVGQLGGEAKGTRSERVRALPVAGSVTLNNLYDFVLTQFPLL